MNKILLVLCAICIGSGTLTAQTKQQTQQQPPAQQQTSQKKPPPYLYKTDFDKKMTEVDAKVNSAVGTAMALKKELSGKLDKVDELDTKMQQVEEILGTANLKISSTSDSLKNARKSAQEFREMTEKSLASLTAKDNTTNKALMGVGIFCVLLLAGVGFVVMTMGKRNRALKNIIHQQAADLSTKMDEGLNKHQKEMKDEVVYLKLKMQDDLRGLKNELSSNLSASSEDMAARLQLIMDKLDK